MKKVAIFITLYKRPVITEACFLGIKRLKKEFDGRIIFTVHCMGHEGDGFEGLCKRFKYYYYTCPDDTLLGKKINLLINQIRGHEWDYLMKVDSDDILTGAMLNQWLEFMTLNIPFFGSRDKFVIDIIGKRAKYFNGYADHDMSVSGGRMICREVIEALEGKICKPFLKKGIDYSIKLQLQKIGVIEKIYFTGANYELKSPVNIHGYDDLSGRPVSVDVLLKELSHEEQKIINHYSTYAMYRKGHDAPGGITKDQP